MILFLFVVMLLGAERLPGTEPLRGQRVAAGVVFVVLLVEAGVMVVLRGQAGLGSLAPPTGKFASPADIGMALFTQYSLPFELTSVLLVVAAVGAIVLTHRSRKEQRLLSPTSSSETSTGAPSGSPGVGQSAGERSSIPTPLSSPFQGGERSNPAHQSSSNSEVQGGQGGEGI
jgi:NADH-quinone oxidoreductase subunit J